MKNFRKLTGPKEWAAEIVSRAAGRAMDDIEERGEEVTCRRSGNAIEVRTPMAHNRTEVVGTADGGNTIVLRHDFWHADGSGHEAGLLRVPLQHSIAAAAALLCYITYTTYGGTSPGTEDQIKTFLNKPRSLAEAPWAVNEWPTLEPLPPDTPEHVSTEENNEAA